MHTYQEMMEFISELQNTKKTTPPASPAPQEKKAQQHEEREYHPSINLEPTLDCPKRRCSGADQDPLMRDILN